MESRKSKVESLRLYLLKIALFLSIFSLFIGSLFAQGLSSTLNNVQRKTRIKKEINNRLLDELYLEIDSMKEEIHRLKSGRVEQPKTQPVQEIPEETKLDKVSAPKEKENNKKLHLDFKSNVISEVGNININYQDDSVAFTRAQVYVQGIYAPYGIDNKLFDFNVGIDTDYINWGVEDLGLTASENLLSAEFNAYTKILRVPFSTGISMGPGRYISRKNQVIILDSEVIDRVADSIYIQVGKDIGFSLKGYFEKREIVDEEKTGANFSWVNDSATQFWSVKKAYIEGERYLNTMSASENSKGYAGIILGFWGDFLVLNFANGAKRDEIPYTDYRVEINRILNSASRLELRYQGIHSDDFYITAVPYESPVNWDIYKRPLQNQLAVHSILWSQYFFQNLRLELSAAEYGFEQDHYLTIGGLLIEQKLNPYSWIYLRQHFYNDHLLRIPSTVSVLGLKFSI